MSEYSVELKGLNKVYSNLLKEDTVALKDINLQIRPGEFISIIGPSGCGKSTLLRIIGNLDKPTSGTIEYRDGADQQMGFVFQDSVLLPWKNVRQNAEFPLVIQKKQTEENEKKLDELLELAGLSEFKTALPRELSGGMKRKLMVCRALLTDPEILLLDEPTAGMDALSRRQMWNLLRKLNGKNLTILLTTHYMEEAQNLCSRVALMDHGKLEEVNTPAGLIDSLGNYTVDEFAGDETHSHYFHSREEAIAYLSGLSGQASLRETTLEDVFVERAGRHLMPS